MYGLLALSAVAALTITLSGCAVVNAGTAVVGAGVSVVGTAANVAGDVISAPFGSRDSGQDKKD
jgi:hypothetical protein